MSEEYRERVKAALSAWSDRTQGNMTMKQAEAAVSQEWTEKRVREELPDVTVKFHGTRRELPAVVRGKELPFAQVITSEGHTAEYAWSTIANCLNSGRPLLF